MLEDYWRTFIDVKVSNEYLPTSFASVIILLAQIISALQPIYPFGDRLYASKCIYEQLRQLALTVEQTFNNVQYGSMNEEDLPAALAELQRTFASIESNIAAPDLFPRKKRLHQKTSTPKSGRCYFTIFELAL